VVVRRRHRLGVEVVRARTERADDEAVALERLVHRRRLMNAPDDRLEVVDVERPGIEVSVPANDVERVVIEDELVQTVILLHEELEVAHLVMRAKLDGATHVALGIRSALLELTELVAIALGPAYVAAALHDEELRLISLHVELVAMKDTAMDDEVVALVEGEI